MVEPSPVVAVELDPVFDFPRRGIPVPSEEMPSAMGSA